MVSAIQTLSKGEQKPHLMMLVFLISFGTVCAVLFTPGLPNIAQFYNVSHNQAQMCISLYMLGYALGQLPYGPLANRYGRKYTLNIGASVQILGALLCVASIHLTWFELMLLGRFIMALGASVGLMMAFTLLNDFYPTDQARMISAKLMASFAILPGVALTLGGFLCEHFGWMWCFYILFAYGILSLFLIKTYVPHQATVQHQADIKSLLLGLLKAAKHKQVVLFAMLMGGSTAMIYIYNALSPFMGIDFLHLSQSQFGSLSAIPPLGILLGSSLSHILNRRYSGLQVIQMGIFSSLGIVILMAIGFQHHMSAWILFAGMFCIYLTLTLVLSNASVLSSSASEDKANSASVMNFINMSCGAIGTSVIQGFNLTLMLLPIALGVILVLMGLIAMYCRSQS